MDTIQQGYAKRLKEFRKSLNPKVSQTDLAKFLNITQAAYSLIEKGQNRISCDLLHYMAINYNLNVYWLLTGEGEKQQHNQTASDEKKENQILKSVLTDLESAIDKIKKYDNLDNGSNISARNVPHSPI